MKKYLESPAATNDILVSILTNFDIGKDPEYITEAISDLDIDFHILFKYIDQRWKELSKYSFDKERLLYLIQKTAHRIPKLSIMNSEKDIKHACMNVGFCLGKLIQEDVFFTKDDRDLDFYGKNPELFNSKWLEQIRYFSAPRIENRLTLCKITRAKMWQMDYKKSINSCKECTEEKW